MSAWGYSAMYNLSRCNPYSIRCAVRITDFSKELVKRIDMVPYGNPIIKHFGTGNKTGYTLIQLIETSNITAHFVEENNSAYVDVFSCKDFESKEVEKVLMEFFQPHHIDSQMVPRQAKEMM